MPNSFAKKIDVFFDDVVAGFDATNISSKNVSQYKAPAEALALNGQTFHRPMPLMLEVEDGRDMTNKNKDVIDLTVPATLTEAHIRNVPVSLTGVDLNNPYAFDNIVKTSKILLSNKLDTLVANRIAERGTLAVINSGTIDTYDDAAEADALMLEQQATRGERIMLLNPRMAKNLSGNLAARQTMGTASMNAYQRSALPPIAGFDTFRTDYGRAITGSAGAGYLVSGAQSYTPVSADANGVPVDNRTQTLAVKTGTGAAVGDVFTIAGVYAVGHINKQSTGQLKTFRILAINGGNWTISPAIVPADGAAAAQKAYANVTTGAAADAAITILNKKTSAASVFYEKSAIEIVHADFNTEPFEASGKRVRKATTDSGIQIVMLTDSNVDTLAAKYRLFVWANVEVLNPELAGIMLENQT